MGLEETQPNFLVAVAWEVWLLGSTCPADDCEGRGVDHHYQAEDA